MERALPELEVLVMDCQATGADPAKSRLLELGWSRTRAARTKDAPESYLVRWPNDAELPRRIQKVTGITKEALTGPSAHPLEEIWQRLLDAAHDVARVNGQASCPTVIHFCRFEKAYLQHLSQRFSFGNDFSFRTICTHEIVRRLLPDLPRRGLRPVVGYFGCSVPELRRTASHVRATVYLWRRLVDQLGEKTAVRTEAQLRRWLEATPASTSTGRTYPMDREVRLRLPEGPGVYRMLRSNGDVLYIGKARNLRHRVNSYFQKRRHAEHTLEMLTQASRLDFTLCPTALEAALAESDEIKRSSPPYNIALRGGERRITFASPDGLSARAAPDADHPIGPLPSDNALVLMGALAEALDTGSERLFEDWPHNVGLHAAYAPEKVCFHRGLELFARKHDKQWQDSTTLATLTRLGATLWRERLASMQEEEKEEKQSEGEEKRQWTPERVASWLEHQVLRAAHLQRRARWLCLLSESALAWSPRNTDGSRKRLLVFSGGGVVHRALLPADAPTPVPDGLTRAVRERQSSFDLITYDRLSVVTTELKGLLQEGRAVELRVSAGTVLSLHNLTRALQWL